MNAERLLEVYEQISEAPDAVTRLRRFVLDLAVRGKLLEQDAGDEPAHLLLRKIEAEKDHLVKAGEIRKRDAKPVSMLPPPFEIPASWCWTATGTIFAYDAGVKTDPKDLDANQWLLELEDVEKVTGRLLQKLKVGDREAKSTKSEFRSGDVLYGKLRPYLNKVVVADQAGYSTTEIVAIRPFLPLCPEYVALAFRRPDFVDYVERKGQGTKMPRLRTEDAVVAPFPLPPLAEQHRIVAKVNELMALCDRLEEARKTREETRDKLTAASLARLTAPDTTAEDFPTHANFALEVLPALTTRSDQIKTLRQTILNLAVRGKLAEQDPADEPAETLLKKAQEDIAIYGQANGVRPAKVDKIRDVPFDLRSGWAWTRLVNIFRVVTDGDHQPPPRADAGVAFLTIGNVSGGTLEFDDCRRVPQGYFDALPRYRTPSAGDLLYTVVGATFGRPVVVGDHEPFCVQRHIAILKPSSEIHLPFLGLLMASPFVYSQAKEALTGAAQPTLALRPLRNFMLPIPPLAEQHRIVAKVDALMALCDRLDAALTTTDTTRTRLLEALLHEALEPDAVPMPEAAE